MPKVTGIELLKQIRSNEATKQLLVILVTGERNKDEIAKAIANKVSGYVMKPFEADTLFKTIKSAADRAKT
jgi:CheY-like chemotaxis protein